MLKKHIFFVPEEFALHLLDQRSLPAEETYVICQTMQDIITALQTMVVRGAPAIGVTAAWGCVLAARKMQRTYGQNALAASFAEELRGMLDELAQARPTAVNLLWAVSKMRELWEAEQPEAIDKLLELWIAEAQRLQEEDIAINRKIGHFGASLIADGDNIMTHCNAGELATAGYGTALGVIYAAAAEEKRIAVIANETRPFLQGARLTAYELRENDIPATVACDNACGLLMKRGLVHKVIVGADRIAANGDTANKIGTYVVAVMAKRHNIPFYVAAPLSTIDRKTPDGNSIPIEERTPSEVEFVGSTKITPDGIPVYNYAFDITPAELISGIITEKGVLLPPFEDAIRYAFERE